MVFIADNNAIATETGAFLQALIKSIKDEATTQKKQIDMQWSKSLINRVQLGVAIHNLRIIKLDPNGDIWLAYSNNHSRFREGDTLLLNRGNPFDDPKLRVTLEREEHDYLVVKANEKDPSLHVLTAFRDDWVLDEDVLDLSAFYLQALELLPRTAVGQARILPLFLNQITSDLNFSRREEILESAIPHLVALNSSQRTALAEAYATNLAYLIQGPPGTGKTHVLADLVKQLVDEGERVLITSFTHRAINNALRKIGKRHPDLLPSIAKIGMAQRGEDLVEYDTLTNKVKFEVENYERYGDSPFVEFEEEGYALGATPFAGQTSRLEGATFDTVIFDEASQITVPLAIMALLKGTDSAYYIFIGDDKQMPPVLVTRSPENLVHQSVFAFLKKRTPYTVLNTTYRMNAALTQWSSHHFYNNKLVTDISNRDRVLVYKTAPTVYSEILDPAHSKVFVDLQINDTSPQSDPEAQLITDLIKVLLDSGVAATEIGVVAPYRKQGRKIRALLRTRLKSEPQSVFDNLIIDTVERMQGQEREVILISLTTTSSSVADKLKEFFFQPERLNVAVTRAKSKLIILGSSYVISEDLKQYPPAALLADLMQSCHVVTVSGRV
jgi:DNA replication ATP-dependent helicase Dna2